VVGGITNIQDMHMVACNKQHLKIIINTLMGGFFTASNGNESFGIPLLKSGLVFVAQAGCKNQIGVKTSAVHCIY